MKRIETIKVNNKNYDIFLMPVGIDKDRWVCAYVKLKPIKEIAEDYLDNCTYHEEDVYGIDTAHSHNFNMSYEEKEEDAIKQITGLIKDFNNKLNEDE